MRSNSISSVSSAASSGSTPDAEETTQIFVKDLSGSSTYTAAEHNLFFLRSILSRNLRSPYNAIL